MKWSWLTLVVLVGSGGVWSVGCGDDDASGTAPSISNLTCETCDATPLALNESQTLYGSFDFADPDGDVELMQMDVLNPNGLTSVAPDTALSNVAGAETGSVSWNVTLAPTQTGTYELTLRLVDAEGNVSNELQDSFEVQ